MSDSNFIHDGYTKSGYIAPAPGFHSGLRFKWRPMLTQLRAECFEKLAKATNGKERDAIYARIMKTRLVTWDARDDKGHVEITAETILKLESNLFLTLWEIVASLRPTDIDPDIANTKTSGEKDVLDYLESGKPYVAHVIETEEAAEKN